MLKYGIVLLLLLSACADINETAGGKNYLADNPEDCSRIRFQCTGGQVPFFDENGCGCGPAQEAQLEGTACEDAARGVMCAQVYEPACGWFDESIQCIKYPCAQTFSNSCEACANAQVVRWTPGECPAG